MTKAPSAAPLIFTPPSSIVSRRAMELLEVFVAQVLRSIRAPTATDPQWYGTTLVQVAPEAQPATAAEQTELARAGMISTVSKEGKPLPGGIVRVLPKGMHAITGFWSFREAVAARRPEIMGPG